MTMTLDAPTEAPDLVVIEEHQHDVPLTCTRGGPTDSELPDYCSKPAEWEALCFSCGHVFRRCAEHRLEDVHDAILDGDGVASVCAPCMGAGKFTPVYADQYTRIPA